MSSQEFIRALKTQPDDPRSIEIARSAWDDRTFYAPRKGEAIADWILTRFSKGHKTIEALFDVRYWDLLHDVISSNNSEPWLYPLFSRISFAPIIVSYLGELSNHSIIDTISKFQYCLEIIWPLVLPKITVEQLLDCFGSLLVFLKNNHTITDPIRTIGRYILTSYRKALLVTALKKKICTTFIQELLPNWTDIVSQTHTELHREIQLGGIETLFNLDVLRDGKLEQVLFDKLASLPLEIVIPTLPILFSSFIQIARKYRGALFGQSANRESSEDFCSAGFRFFSSCQGVLSKCHTRLSVWSCRASLLNVIDQENVFTGGSSPENNAALRGVVTSALVELTPREKGFDLTLIHPIIQTLSAIIRIDYLFIGPFLSDIISKLLVLPSTETSAFGLLELLLDYHSKTRTIDEYVRALFQATNCETSDDQVQAFHSVALQSPVLHPTHLANLSKSIHDHVTPSQVVQLARFVTDLLAELWSKIDAGRTSKRDKKKQRLDNTNEGPASQFSVAASLAVAILSSFSRDSLQSDSRAEFGSLMNGFCSNALSNMLSTSLKAVRSHVDGSSWSDEVVTTAALRIQYALRLQRELTCEDKASSKKLAELLNSQESRQPSLKIELLRRLLHDSETSGSFNLQELGTFIASNTAMDLEQLAILHLIIQRWIPLLDANGSDAQLEALISVLIEAPANNPAARILVLQCFTSAEFWELPNIRGIFLARIDKSTLPLTALTGTDMDEKTLKQLSFVFDALLLVPVEYLTRTLKVELVRRVLSLDTYLCSQKRAPTISPLLHDLRVLANRLLTDMGPTHQTGLLEALQDLQTQTIPEKLLAETLELMKTCMKTLLKQSKHDSAELESLIQLYSLDIANVEMFSTSFECFVSVLKENHAIKDFSPEPVAAMQSLFKALCTSLKPRLAVFSGQLDTEALHRNLSLLRVWLHVLVLGRWLGINDSSVPLVGSKMCASLLDHSHSTISVDEWRELCGTVFEFNVEETRWHNDAKRLDVILAVYVALRHNAHGEHQSLVERLEISLLALLPDLPAEVYQHALDTVANALTDECDENLQFVIDLAALLLREPPQSTLAITQAFTTQCINTFNARRRFTRGTLPIRLKVLQLISRRCRDRPAALRSLDVGGIWTLLAKTLSKSETHDIETHPEIFVNIFTICNSLIRLRRDLVAVTLPHLTVVLHSLLMTMRSPRPNLGGKQSGLVTDSLPMWINSKQPLGSDEARTLSRLLESLSTKTIVRLHGSSNEAQKAESLAKPFSKHAAYVLKAYVQASNDPLCVFPAAVKKALQPGLFSLCGMTNDFSRDALMVSLNDTSEKAILKALWGEHEKQRYVGKG